MRGRNIHQYSISSEGLYVIVIPAGWTKNRFEKTHDYEKAFKAEFPFLYNYMKTVGDKLEKEKLESSKLKGLYDRDDQGDFWWELRPCDYYSEFETDKLVWLEISKNPNFTLDTDRYYLTNSAYMLKSQKLKFFLAILNSKVADYYFSKFSVQIAGQRHRYTKQYIENMPIPIQTNKQSIAKLESSIDKILVITKGENYPVDEIKQERVKQIQEEIDQLVYALYGLTKDEITIIMSGIQF